MTNFEFPTNVKQIGDIGEGMRIYIEDYVYSYLQQYSEYADFEERLALLIGRYMIIDGEKVLFISGAVQGTETVFENGIHTFTEESWESGYKEIKKYFNGLDVVGWMHSQPGFGITQNEAYFDYHRENFANEYSCLFVIDPKEKLTTFYTWADDMNSIVDTSGYFIYFDKNNGMHEYMLNNKIINLGIGAKFESTFKKLKKPLPPEVDDDIEEESIAAQSISKSTSTKNKKSKNNNVNDKFNLKSTTVKNQNKKINILMSLCSILLLVCIGMETGLVNSKERIASLEEQIASMDNEIDSINKDDTQTVFAQDETEVPVDTNSVTITPVDTSNKSVDEDTSNQSTNENTLEDIVVPIETPDEQVATIPEETEEEIITETSEITSPEPTEPTTNNEESTSKNPIYGTNNVPETYVVQKGDSLGYISMKFYGNLSMGEDIMTLNGMSDPDQLYYGQVITLP